MDLYSFPPIAAVLDGAYAALSALVDALVPLAGSASAAAAIVLVTLLVRAALIPVGVSQRRAELVRRRLAPRLRALQLKYASNPELLRPETAELYRLEQSSPLAGCLPLLVQAPVLSTVYTLFVLATIDGHTNALLAHGLFGVPLGGSLVHLVMAGPLWPGMVVFAVLLAVLAGISFLSRRVALRQKAARAETATATATGLSAALSWLPFVTVLVAGIVPLAAVLYLTVSTAWTLAERTIIGSRLR